MRLIGAIQMFVTVATIVAFLFSWTTTRVWAVPDETMLYVIVFHFMWAGCTLPMLVIWLLEHKQSEVQPDDLSYVGWLADGPGLSAIIIALVSALRYGGGEGAGFWLITVLFGIVGALMFMAGRYVEQWSTTPTKDTPTEQP